MRKYRWALLKVLEFLNMRMPEFDIRATFIHQLAAYENRLIARGLEPKTVDWTEVFDQSEFDNEELMLTNTYLNSQIGPIVEYTVDDFMDKKGKLRWADENKKKLTTIIEEKSKISKQTSLTLIRNNSNEHKHKRTNSDKNHLVKIPQKKITITTHKPKKEKKNFKMKENLSSTESKVIVKSHSEKCIRSIGVVSPEIAELIDFFPAKAQLIPKLNTALTLFHTKKHSTKDLPESSSNFNTIHKGVLEFRDIGKARSYLKVEKKESYNHPLGITQFKMRVGNKAEPLKGESVEYTPEKLIKKRYNTPTTYLKKENIHSSRSIDNKHTNTKPINRIRIRTKPLLRKSNSEATIPKRFSYTKYSLK